MTQEVLDRWVYKNESAIIAYKSVNGCIEFGMVKYLLPLTIENIEKRYILIGYNTIKQLKSYILNKEDTVYSYGGDGQLHPYSFKL